MPALKSKEAIERRNMADLAKEFALPLADIRVLYEAQRTRLMTGATVGKYFTTFAMRNIRVQLRKRRAEVVKI